MDDEKTAIRRTDRAEGNASDLTRDLARLRKPLAGESELASALNVLVREGDLYEKLPDNRVHCYACAHNCNIADGGRGICQVRYNVNGTLFVPRGYVAALQCDPIEKKPFFHVLPSSDALTFGMLGCDLHCGYCFTGDVVIMTKRGPSTFADLFSSAARVEERADGQVAYPENAETLSASGTWRKIEAVFKHPYRGEMLTLKPMYLPALTCTPDHRVYATADPNQPPQKISARHLTRAHYLAVPRKYSQSTPQTIFADEILSARHVTYRVAWDLTRAQRAFIAAASAEGISSREIGARLGKSGAYIRHVRSKLRRGRGDDSRTQGFAIEQERVRFPNEHRPGIPRVIPLNESLARLLGYYCAEGSVVSNPRRPNSHVLNFSFAPHETRHVAEVQALLIACLGIPAHVVPRQTTRALACGKASAALLFKQLCGERAQEKRVPTQLFDAPHEIVEAFLDAYTAGDGHIYANGKRSVTTTSTALAYGIAYLALKLGYCPSVYDATPSPDGTIMGRRVRRSPHQYTVVWYHDANIQRNVIETADYYLIPLRDISSASFEGAVYNMQVQAEHNYLANLTLVSNCQNWDISQALRDPASGHLPSLVTPQQMVEIGKQQHARVFASSYNEPLITSEWAVEIFKEATKAGFLCAYVSNGNATREVLEYIKPYVRAYKIDLKSMRDKNYRQLGAPLEHILEGIRLVHQMGFWLEIVTLVVPGFNDSVAELRDAAQFIASLSPDIPWHVTAFHQDYKMLDKDNTTVQDLLRACEIGRDAGLHFVYAGNLPGHVGEWENTYCPKCRALLIRRHGYMLTEYHITAQGTCPKCQHAIPGIWHQDPRAVRLGDANLWWTRRPRAV
jgi:pyruvate formate lyase activating enzyme